MLSSPVTISAGVFGANFQIPQIWPYHAALMISGLSLMAAGAILATKRFRKNRWWLKTHKTLGPTGAIVSAVGLFVAIYMVSASGAGHFRVPHAFLGAAALAFAFATPILGYARFRYLNKPKIRTVHVWFGRIAIILMAANVISGLILAGVV
ncbi:MAG: hypothetical protein PHH26_07100 [Candidatus Thermoplasmatota archaeon]|nr:hypothetical protein [Candidatus Thermoplasmatota archaeon]